MDETVNAYHIYQKAYSLLSLKNCLFDFVQDNIQRQEFEDLLRKFLVDAERKQAREEAKNQ